MAREKILAAVDLGPQAVQMLVAKVCANGSLETINEYVATTQLASNLAETGVLSEESMEKTVRAAKEMQEIALKEGSSSMVVTACSAIREAANRSKFLLLCHQRLNIYPQLLSGKDEARLNFLGITQALEGQNPVLALSVGPLNMSMAFGFKGSIAGAANINIGAVALEKLYSLGSSPSMLKAKGATGYVKHEMEEPVKSYGEWTESLQSNPDVMVSGSIANNLAALIRQQPVLDFKVLNNTPCLTADVLEQYKRLAKLKTKERLAIGGVEQEIETYIVSGLFLLHNVLTSLNVDSFRISSSGMRTGVLKYFMGIP